ADPRRGRAGDARTGHPRGAQPLGGGDPAGGSGRPARRPDRGGAAGARLLRAAARRRAAPPERPADHGGLLHTGDHGAERADPPGRPNAVCAGEGRAGRIPGRSPLTTGHRQATAFSAPLFYAYSLQLRPAIYAESLSRQTNTISL